MEQNPYAAPQSQVLQSTTSDEAIRQEHINTEATIKSVGVLYYLGAFLLIVAGIPNFLSQTSPSGVTVTPIGIGILLVVLGLGFGFVGRGLRGLQSWARIPTIIFACFGLLGFPLGTLINAYILVKVCGKQGSFVMTPEYQRIIEATPHIKRKSSILAMVLLAILIIVLIGIIAAVVIR